MKVTIHLLPTRRETKVLELGEGATAESAIRTLGLYPDAWIAVRGGVPIAADESLQDGDEVKLISAVSGG